jgi:spermidine dehydrogenase
MGVHQVGARPCVVARQPYGLIAIAISDAGPAHTLTMLGRHRAVGDVLNRRAMPKLAE